MCAIIGWKGHVPVCAARAMLRQAENWGRHAAGFAYWGLDGELEVFKRAANYGMTGGQLLLRNHGRRFNELCRHRTVILHTRTGTHGPNIDDNAHPFTRLTDDTNDPTGLFKPMAWAHNGIVSNYLDIAAKYATPRVVDSQCLGALIEHRRLGEARGSVGVVWLADGEVYCYRRSQRLGVWHGFTGFGRLTVAATDQSIIEQLPWTVPPTKTSLEEGSAYKLTDSGPVEVWEDLTEFPVNRPAHIHTGYVGAGR